MHKISTFKLAKTMNLTNLHPDTRLTLLLEWIATLPDFSLQAATLRPASADASFRRYFRIDDANNQSFILMDAPPPHEDVRPFIQIAHLFNEAGVTVPQVFASHIEQGFLLLSDLGSTMYADILKKDRHAAQGLYVDAIHSLIKIQTHSQVQGLPNYDKAMQLREVQLFPEWFIAKHLQTDLSPTQCATLNEVFEHILANTTAQTKVCVHRDYHSRNLMAMERADSNPGILDFQGAVVGPITYDIASLLKDAYIEWPEEQVLDWAIRYWERARAAGLPAPNNVDEFYKDMEYMGLQRHIKVLGIFCRLAYRDGKHNYLADLPLVLSYVKKTAQRYRPLLPLARLMDELGKKAPQVGYTF
jgi:hypothetical protein